MVGAVETAIDKMKFAKMLSGENDRAGALVSINAGAGGVDAQDWAEMLLRMYMRWCERKGYKIEMLDHQPGEEAGIKSASFTVEGEWAYRLPARGERRAPAGAHLALRRQRAPPDLVRRRLRLSRPRRDHQDRDPRRGPRGADLPLGRRRRAARQQDRVGGAHHPHADRHRRRLPDRALAAQEPLDGDEDAARQALRAPGAGEGRPRWATSTRRRRRSSGARRSARTCSRPTRWSTTTAPSSRSSNVDTVLDGELDDFIQAYLLQQGSEDASNISSKA